MTCIVGLVHNKKVYIGGDSAGVSCSSIHTRADKKVFINGDFIMGFTSSFRMGQLIEHSFIPPSRLIFTEEKELKYKYDDVPDSLFRYMVLDFVNHLKYSLENGGFMKVVEGEHRGGTFLVGTEGRLFTIDSDFQVAEQVSDYTAVGIGEEYALGAMHALEYSTCKPRKKLKIALEAASEFSTGVCGPFTILHIG